MTHRRISWAAAPLRWKVTSWFYAIMVIMVLILSAMIILAHTTFRAFERVQQSHMIYYEMQEALELEQRAFETCMREDSQENRANFEEACGATEKAMEALPFDYELLGEDRYARTWNILHGYAGYRTYRDAVMAADPGEADYVERIYKVIDMQEYLSEYAMMIVQATIEQNSHIYRRQASLYAGLPWLYVCMGFFAVGAVGLIIGQFSKTVVDPVLVLAEASRKIAGNDFTGDDLQVCSADELGGMTREFNRMKHAMGEHIATLEKLHREELSKVALQRDLDRTRLEMLRSQVDPHFLFNTLNMISCMARLEDAATTDKMILSLSGIFRYNLRTKAQEVRLEEELGVLEDYLYLQKMRFDGRVTCRVILDVDPARVRIPSFTLQPVVENAFRHGLKTREDGGRITVRIWQEEDKVTVSIADNGRGMTPEERGDLHRRIAESEHTGRGIGLGNIHRRIQMLYPDTGELRIHSRPGRGTVVQMVIPQCEREETLCTRSW